MRHIEVFHAINVAGSVTAAARILGVSQPAVSRMLSHLEGRLHFPLFARNRGRLVPTSEGKKLFEAAGAAQEHIERIRSLASDLRTGEALPLRIAANPSMALSVVPRAIALFRARFPAVPIQVDIGPSETICEFIAQERVDFAVVLLPIEHSAVETCPLGQANVVCVMPAGHPLSAKASISPADLSDVPLVSFSRGTAQGLALDEAFAQFDVIRRTAVTVRYAHTACHFAVNGVGVALVDSFSVTSAVASQAAIRPFKPATSFTAYGAWSALRPRPRFATAWLNELRKAVASHPLTAASLNRPRNSRRARKSAPTR